MNERDVDRAENYNPDDAPTLYDWLMEIRGMTHGVALDLDTRIPESVDMPTPQALWTMAGINRERRGRMEINILPSLLDFFDHIQVLVAEAINSPKYRSEYGKAYDSAIRSHLGREAAEGRASATAMLAATGSKYAEMYFRRLKVKKESMQRRQMFADDAATFNKVLHSRVRHDVMQMFLGHVWSACWWIDRGYAPPVTFGKPIPPEVPYPGTPGWIALVSGSRGNAASHESRAGG